jgi:hypothetical protein
MLVQSSLLSLYSASATTLQFVMKCCFSSFTLFSLSYASSNCSHIHNCFTVYVEQMLMSGSQLLTFSKRALCTTACCFYCTSVNAIFRILSSASSFFMYVPCILYSLLSRPTNAQNTHTHTHTHIYKQYFILHKYSCVF